MDLTLPIQVHSAAQIPRDAKTSFFNRFLPQPTAYHIILHARKSPTKFPASLSSSFYRFQLCKPLGVLQSTLDLCPNRPKASASHIPTSIPTALTHFERICRRTLSAPCNFVHQLLHMMPAQGVTHHFPSKSSLAPLRRLIQSLSYCRWAKPAL